MSARPLLPRIAVVGASTLVGEAVLDELRSARFENAALYPLDDMRRAGRPLADDAGPGVGGAARAGGAPRPGGAAGAGGVSGVVGAGGAAGAAALTDPEEENEDRVAKIGDVAAFDFRQADLVFFCAGAALAERYAEEAAAHAWVLDGSSAFRARRDVPLIVADVNATALRGIGRRGLIALPGSASVALATALAPLDALAGVLRVDVATYHAVSGSGRGAMDELAGETVAMLSGKPARGRAFGRQIAFNVIPQVDAFDADGASREEQRLWDETRRLLGRPELAVNATAVRVPVFFGHSLAVHAVFERPLTVDGAATALRAAPGIRLLESAASSDLPTPATLAQTPDHVYVGRLRADVTRERALNFWVVGDNVRKCAAHNAVSTARILVNGAR